jgi:DNA polymerase-3 subunit epsilon
MRADDARPLHEVTFCVLDLETTGGSPADDRICEIGAVKVRGGEVLGTFHTLVDPGRAIPPFITMLTGLTDAIVRPAPTVEAVLPSLVEFLRGTVFVGHNVRFDAAFLDAAFEREGFPRLAGPRVCTAALARRLVHDQVPDCRLSTLASRLRLDHQPSHRAFADALATVDLLHLLLERASGLGVFALDDLVALPRQAGSPSAAKLRLTEHLPRSPGVYAFRGGQGKVLYVGRATNLRARTRSYFADGRRAIGGLLRATVAIDHLVCSSTLQATALEARLLQRLAPPANLAGKPRAPAYVRLDPTEAFARLAVVRRARGDAALHLGPLPAASTARLVVEAVESVVPLRRCTAALGRASLPCRDTPCTPAQLGVASCPCAGSIGAEPYRAHVQQATRAFEGLGAAAPVLGALAERMRALAAARRYEEAALVRDRAGALADTLERHERLAALRAAGRIEIRLRDGAGAVVDRGLLVDAWDADGRRVDPAHPLAAPPPKPVADGAVLTPEQAAEAHVVAAWLARERGWRVVALEGAWHQPWVAQPRPWRVAGEAAGVAA